MSRDRLKDINKFLLQFRKELLDKPDMINSITNYNNTYYNLVRCNTTERVDNTDLFDYWIRNNKRKNTSVFVDPHKKYFCQFVSQVNELCDPTKHYKIYLSLKPDYLQEGADRLFNYLSEENIPHLSKIGRKSRDDQIVVRVVNEEDCKKVIDFINNDPYIQEGKKKPNPFTYNNRGVPIAFDGSVSYNQCMSIIISNYLIDMANSNRIKEIKVNSFIDYVVNYYNKYFVKKENTSKLIDDFRLLEKNDPLDFSKLVDYKYCVILLLKGFDKEFNFDKYEDLIEEKKNIIGSESSQFRFNYYEKDYIKLFDELCNVMTKKYGFDGASSRIKAFFNDSRYDCITRDNNLRRRTNNNSFISFMKEYARNESISLDNLIDKYCQKYNMFILPEDDKKIFNDGIIKTYNYHQKLYENGDDKYDGYQYAMSAITRLIRLGKYDGFTRNDNVRMKVKQRIDKDKANNILLEAIGVNNIDDTNLDELSEQYITRLLSNGKVK